ncbi:MAG: hypothetical protein SGILL_010271 [Bacillariaceae sp.]
MSSTLIHNVVSQVSMDSNFLGADRKRGRGDDDVSEASSLTGMQFDKMKRMMQERRFSDASASQMAGVSGLSETMEEIQEEGRFPNTEEEDDGDVGSAGASSGADASPENVMELLARDITNLSLTEREQVFQEIHGVREQVQETPEYMQEHHRAMQGALDGIPVAKRKAYNLALQLDPSYVGDVELRTRFLRCEMWDAIKAATRFVKHFEQKLDLFGKDLLCTTIRQRHLSPGARQAVMEGSSQMPARDSSGRLVAIQFSNLGSNPSRSPKVNLERTFAETKQVLASFGIPVDQLPIDDNGDAHLSPAHTQRWETRRQWEEEQDAKGGLQVLPSVLSPLRFSNDDQASPNASINSFPISSNSDEASNTQKLDPGIRKANSEEKAASPTVSKKNDGKKSPTKVLDDTPIPFKDLTTHDVLLGRGKRLDKHAGNVQFRKYVSEKRIQYDDSSQPIKSMICREIYGMVQEQNGRFLQLKSGKYGPDSEWAEVTDEAARTKIANCFRSLRRKIKTEES